MPVRKHRCVGNHVGSAKLMECKSRVQEIKELSDKETLVEVLERSGNTTVLAHIKRDLQGTLKKRYDCNCIVNNIVTDLYAVKKIVNVLYNTYKSVLNLLFLRMKVSKQEWKKASEQ